MNAVDDEVLRVCADIRAGEVADMTRNFLSMGYELVVAAAMAELVMRELEHIVLSGPPAWRSYAVDGFAP